MFDMIITKRFEGHDGHEMVRSREYIIEEGSSGQKLNRVLSLAMCLRPGQKIDMSMVFPEWIKYGNYCPRCLTRIVGTMETKIQW